MQLRGRGLLRLAHTRPRGSFVLVLDPRDIGLRCHVTEMRDGLVPALEQLRSLRRARVLELPLDEPAQLVTEYRAGGDELRVQSRLLELVDKRLAAAHPRAEVAADLSED